MSRLRLWQKLALLSALLLVLSGMALLAMQARQAVHHEQEVVQRLSLDLAAHIARRSELMDAGGMRDDAVRSLFGQLMAVNPSVEVYLLDTRGEVIGHDAPAGHLRRQRVDLGPLRALLDGAPLPILGDDPRSADGRKIFSAAPLVVQGRLAGYIYVVLVGEQRQMLADDLAASGQWRATLWSAALVALAGVLAALLTFYWITRPLRQLTKRIEQFDVDAPVPAQAPEPLRPGTRDELAILNHAHARMAQRLADQWQQLREQDLQRRELVANISHDLRTPLASLHGYLETLAMKETTLSEQERRRYLAVALAQSGKVGALARSLFELARLEHGGVALELETFALPELVQDVLQKFELAAQACQVRLHAEFPPGLPLVCVDVGLVERALTNLVDNALRHAQDASMVQVILSPDPAGVRVLVQDDGARIDPSVGERLRRQSPGSERGRGGNGGLGLLIVQRIVQLHGHTLVLEPSTRGARFAFVLPRG